MLSDKQYPRIIQTMSFRVCFILSSAKLRYYLLCLILATVSTSLISYIVMSTNTKAIKSTTSNKQNKLVSSRDLFSNSNGKSELHLKLLRKKMKRLSEKLKNTRSIILNGNYVSYKVHIFYYAWYGNPKFDGQYGHWNHKYLSNWKKDDHKMYPNGAHLPPEDVGSNYYPFLGCYSSRDPGIINEHMKQIKNAGIGVIVVSWVPPNFTDSPNTLLPTLFQAAASYNVKIALHVEPYLGRNPINLLDHLRIFLKEYAAHPALFKVIKPASQRKVPVVYIYDSYLIPAIAWKELLSNKGNFSIRGTNLDAIFLGLLVDMQHRQHIKKSQFDGFYTYFSTNSFTYGSTWKNWHSLSKFSKENDLIFAPSVGPGYMDTQIRPWNLVNTRHRRHGQYYDVAWHSAISNNANFVSITSFNEWHEGTQIEPAVPKIRPGFSYLDYEPEGPYFYLNLTKWWIQQFNTKS